MQEETGNVCTWLVGVSMCTTILEGDVATSSKPGLLGRWLPAGFRAHAWKFSGQA